MLINLWYVVEWSDNLKDKPIKTKVLGQDLVLFRDESGKAHCLINVCIHRGGSLAGGWTENDNVVCPYHGWEFGGDGQCKLVPSEGRDYRISDRFQVDAYPTEERYGMIWAFLGDLPEEERFPIPDFPEYGDDSVRLIKAETTWDAEASRVVENGIDLAHTAFVHPTFGYPDMSDSNQYKKMENNEYSGLATAVTYPPKLEGMQRSVRKDKQATHVHPGWSLPGMVAQVQIELKPGWTVKMFDCNTPIDEHTTRTFAWQSRTFFKWPIFDNNSRKRLERIFREDKVIVQAANPYYLPEQLKNEVSVGHDKFISAFRAARRNLINKGWQIDGFEVARHMGRRVFTIPSPNRKELEAQGKTWVFEKIPLVPAEKEVAAA